LIVVDEMDPGSQAFNAWTNVLHVADIVAAAAVLFPIVWSIKHLRDAQAADRGDEKAKDTLIRLTQFRTFYMLTLGWLYFTRIVVYLIAASIAWDRQWLAPLVAELATLGYYLWTGYRFRPAPDNSDYLRVPADDDGPATAGAGLEMTATAPSGGAIDDDDEEQAKGRTTAAAPRAKAVPSQSVSSTKIDKDAAEFAANAASGASSSSSSEGSGAAALPAKAGEAASSSTKKAQPAIADDDDEFGLDEEDLQYELGVKPPQQSGGGLKKVAKD
jgi:Lung seven transmembrane receptor